MLKKVSEGGGERGRLERVLVEKVKGWIRGCVGGWLEGGFEGVL